MPAPQPGPAQTIVTSRGGASAKPCRAMTVRSWARTSGPGGSRTRAPIERTPIAPSTSIGSTPS
jgi:hypothetical protein